MIMIYDITEINKVTVNIVYNKQNINHKYSK